MANIGDIGLSEPAASTISKKLAAVSIDRNSTTQYQEVLVIGSPNSTTALALAEVMGSAPASTTVGLVVRVAEPSTGPFAISSIAGPVTIRSSAANALVSVYQSTAADLNVTVAGYSTVMTVSTGSVRVHQSSAADLNVTVAGYSTTVAVSSIAGPVTVRSSAANFLASVYQSTAADLNATITPASGSTFRTQPGSTLWASSAGFHFNSSGDLKVEASFTGSTTVTVARIVGNSSAADSVPVRIVLADGSTFVNPAVDYTHSGAVTASTVTGPAVMLYASSAAPSSVTDGDMVLQWGTQHGAANVAMVTSSGADMSDSTNAALRVNVVAGSAAGSTIVSVSTGSVRVHQSSAADLNVTVAGYSTTVAVSSIAGPVTVRSSAANFLASVYQSTAADLQATITPASGSTFRTQPGSTLWASSAGFHFNSSGDLKVEASFTGSTTVTVARIVGNSSAADAVPVRIVLADGSTYVSPAIDYTHGGAVTASTVTGPAVLLYASSAAPSSVTDGDMVLQWGTQHGAANVALVTSSGASYGDSTNTAIRVNVVAGAAGGSTIVSVSTGSVRVHQSTAADLNVTVAGYSTTVNVSSLGGAVIVRSSAANFLATIYQSTAADLIATVNLRDGSGNAVASEVTQPSTNSRGLIVRPVIGGLQTYAASTTGQSTATTIGSSNAGSKLYVYAISVMSTHTAMVPGGFYSGSTLLWPFLLSSGYGGFNLAVSPPAYLFSGSTGQGMTLNVDSSNGGMRVGVAYYISS